MSWLGGFVDEWARQDKLEIDRIDKIDRKLSTLIPIIKEDKVKKREVERQAENASNFFEDRLSGVLEGKERDAFLNAVKNDPAKAIKIYQEIVEAEKREGYAKVTGDKLISFYDFIEETIPKGMTRDEWIEKGAKIAATPGINRDELLLMLTDEDVTLSEIRKIEREYSPYVVPTSSFEDFNFEALDVLSQTFITQATNNIVESATAKASLRLTELTSLAAEGSLDDNLEREKIDLENLFTTIERDGDLAILNTGYGAKAFIEQAEFDRRVTKIPGFLETFNRFYDEDGKYIGIQ
jgi:hypothetical protein